MNFTIRRGDKFTYGYEDPHEHMSFQYSMLTSAIDDWLQVARSWHDDVHVCFFCRPIAR